jgi:hypothetical protein
MTPKAFHALFGRIGARAKMPFPIHPHMLRHGCGYALANAGHDTRALQAWLGHKNIQSDTRRRLELAAARGPDRETADRLEKQFAWEAEEATKRSERRKWWGRVAACGCRHHRLVGIDLYSADTADAIQRLSPLRELSHYRHHRRDMAASIQGGKDILGFPWHAYHRPPLPSLP